MPKVLIDIPEELYIETKDYANPFPSNLAYDLRGCVAHGTLLPEDFSLEDYERYKKDSENLSWIKCPEKMGN